MGGGGEIVASDNFERDMFDALQTGYNSTAKLERRAVGDGDEDVEGALRCGRRHEGAEDTERKRVENEDGEIARRWTYEDNQRVVARSERRYGQTCSVIGSRLSGQYFDSVHNMIAGDR